MFEIFICATTTTGAISSGPSTTDPESPTEKRVLNSFLQTDANVAKESITCYRIPSNCHVIEMLSFWKGIFLLSLLRLFRLFFLLFCHSSHWSETAGKTILPLVVGASLA